MFIFNTAKLLSLLLLVFGKLICKLLRLAWATQKSQKMNIWGMLSARFY